MKRKNGAGGGGTRRKEELCQAVSYHLRYETDRRVAHLCDQLGACLGHADPNPAMRDEGRAQIIYGS